MAVVCILSFALLFATDPAEMMFCSPLLDGTFFMCGCCSDGVDWLCREETCIMSEFEFYF